METIEKWKAWSALRRMPKVDLEDILAAAIEDGNHDRIAIEVLAFPRSRQALKVRFDAVETQKSPARAFELASARHRPDTLGNELSQRERNAIESALQVIDVSATLAETEWAWSWTFGEAGAWASDIAKLRIKGDGGDFETICVMATIEIKQK